VLSNSTPDFLVLSIFAILTASKIKLSAGPLEMTLCKPRKRRKQARASRR
jgi:hypothetical protein